MSGISWYGTGIFDELCEKFGVRIGTHEGLQQALKSLMLVAAPAVQRNFIKPVERWPTTCLPIPSFNSQLACSLILGRATGIARLFMSPLLI